MNYCGLLFLGIIGLTKKKKVISPKQHFLKYLFSQIFLDLITVLVPLFLLFCIIGPSILKFDSFGPLNTYIFSLKYDDTTCFQLTL
jgi:hypothetical protein